VTDLAAGVRRPAFRPLQPPTFHACVGIVRGVASSGTETAFSEGAALGHPQPDRL